MLRNYFKIAIRQLYRQKGIASLNVAGLAIGFACAMLIFLYIRHEMSFDQFHEQADQIYRVLHVRNDRVSALTVPPLAQTMVADFPEVTKATHLFHHWDVPLVVVDEQGFYEESFFFADEHFFDVFSFHLLQGDSEHVLADPFTIVLTKSTALRYFGRDNPIGKKIKYNTEFDFTVTGVVEDPPSNSHFKFDMLAAKVSLRDILWSPNVIESWNFGAMFSYIVLGESATLTELEKKLPAFEKKYHDPLENEYLELQALSAVHLHSTHIRRDIAAQGDMTYIYALQIIAALILLVACINYINLMTARAVKRAVEVGLRKVVGATRVVLVRQFVGESLLMIVLVLATTLGLIEALRPVLSRLVAVPLKIHYASDAQFWFTLLGITFIVAVLASGYPALYTSSFQPLKVLRQAGSLKKSRGLLRRFLVIGQFTASAALIVCTLVVLEQVGFLQNKKLGFDQDALVTVPVRDHAVMPHYEAIKQKWEGHHGIISVAASNSNPGENTASTGIRWQGLQSEEPQTVNMYWIGYDYVETMKMELVAGRNFSRELQSDMEQAVLINEELATQMGLTPEEAVGKKLQYWDTEKTVVGVLRDFHFYSLHQKVSPLVLQPDEPELGLLAVRLAGDQTQASLQFMASTWGEFSSNQPFTYSFLDNQLDRMYKAEMQWARIITYSSGLAIFIACLGLIGLATFMAEQRTKEIGIRKVLGANLPGIAFLLSQDFAKLVLAGVALAAPIAYYAMNYWLQSFAYHITLGAIPFILTMIASVAMAVLTVSYQSIRAGMTNPVNALKYE